MSKKTMKRIAVKVGTRVLTGKDNRLDEAVIASLCRQISVLMDRKIEVILVSSGAIGAGLGLLDMEKRGRSLSELQALASIGQNHLMDVYNEHFGKYGYRTGQILLTQEDFNDRKRFLNIRYTLNSLFGYNAVPVINENDSISNDEIKFGDNDRISSLVADIAKADLLVLLTDVEGLYGKDGKIVPLVKAVDRNIRSLCRGKGCEESSGGMLSKIEAARNASHAGIPCIIAEGRRDNILVDLSEGKESGTYFMARTSTMKARKRWIAFGMKPRGSISVDEGAYRAVAERNKSLLPSGIVSVEGKFSEGDVLEIITSNGMIFARGLSNYTSEELLRIKGKRSGHIEDILGYKDYDEAIHRDNLIVLNDHEEQDDR